MASRSDTNQASESITKEGAGGAPGEPIGSRALGSAGVKRSGYPPAVERLIAELARLPGIGRRSAERLAFHVLKSGREDALGLARAIQAVKDGVRHCSVCFNLCEGGGPGESVCAICADPRRDRSMVLVVEQPKDLIALEQTGMYRGLFHVLMGHLAPLEGIGPSELTVAELLRRVDDPGSRPEAAGHEPVSEIVLGLNPTLEGDGTALYLTEQLRTRGVRVTRLARGLPSGGQLEYANKAVLAEAILGRQRVE
ncbi:recombination mediator RecR [Leptolyngbya sp. 15MV]|nr:recombination mediator RecR [Leptolyngbya sp. 15MV]